MEVNSGQPQNERLPYKLVDSDGAGQRASFSDALGSRFEPHSRSLQATQYKVGLEEPDLEEKPDLETKDPLTTQRYFYYKRKTRFRGQPFLIFLKTERVQKLKPNKFYEPDNGRVLRFS